MATQAICNDGILSTEPGIVGPQGSLGPTTNMWYGNGNISVTSSTSASLVVNDNYKQGNRWATTPSWNLLDTNPGEKSYVELSNFLASSVNFSVFVEVKGTFPLLHNNPFPGTWVTLRTSEGNSSDVTMQLITTNVPGSVELPIGIDDFYNAGWRELDFSYLLIALDE